MRIQLAAASLAMYAASRASVQLAHGIVATDGSPIVDTATQGGVVAICIGLVYFFLQRGDRLAKSTKDSRVAELETQVAEMVGRTAGYEQQIKVLDTESHAIRDEYSKARERLTDVMADHISLQREVASLKEQNSSLITLANLKEKNG